MSSAQKRMYVIHEMDDLGTVYNMPCVMKIEGELKLDKIKDIFQKLTQRHESLRTSFYMVEGEPVQKVEEHVDIEVEYEEIDTLTREAYLSFEEIAVSSEALIDVMERKISVTELLKAFVRPFDLGEAPLLRTKLVKCREGYNLVMFDMHHIISDGATMNIITKEFSQMYNGEELKALEVQYKDYSEWMRKKNISIQEAYWLDQFSDEIPVLDLPLDYSRPQTQRYSGTAFDTSMNAITQEQVQQLCRQTGITEYMALLSVFMVLLNKYSRQEDIIVGSPISGRMHQDTESMVGMFVNTLALRGKPEGHKPFANFLAEIREICLKGYENQEYPFEDVVDKVNVKRDMSRNPIFDVMFVMQNNEEEEVSAQGLTLEEVETESGVAKFDLTISVNSTTEGYNINWEYCDELFKEETVRRMAAHFEQIVREILETPTKKISEIEVITETEKNQILFDFNDTKIIYPKDKSIQGLFEDQVKKTPQEIAIVFEGQKMTYDELDIQANIIANELISWGIKPNDVVAFSLKRSSDLIATILGILKSGGAFLPIDTDYPAERKEFIVLDSQAKVLISEGPHAVQEIAGCRQVQINDLLIGINRACPMVEVADQSLCYCIYTSGSTGNPKGVNITHANLLNYLMYCKQEYVTGQPIMPLFTNICFDLTMTSIFVSLCFGGKLFIYNKGIEIDLFDVFSNKELSIIKLTPSHLKLICGHGKAETMNNLKCLIVGGEELESKTAYDTLQKFGMHIDIHNEYGPTETTIGCCDYIYHANSESNTRTVLIGKPISNTQTYIMNENQLCGVGMIGELCIGGEGVGRGYLNRPELTTEKFVNNPYKEGTTIYRTGDLAKWLPDGNLQYLGRIDEQVKVRGFRIELGEIEEVIRKQEGIRDVTVIVREDQAGDKFICAYVVSEDHSEGEKLNLIQVKNEIRKELPYYMVPSHIIEIEQLIMTKNGKLDKRNLPKPEFSSEREYIAPRNDIEEKLATLFKDVLDVEVLGVNDNFFEMGGNSIKAISVIARMRDYGFHVSVLQLFKNSTVATLAEEIHANLSEQEESESVSDDNGFDSIIIGQYKEPDVSELMQNIFQQMNEFSSGLLAQPIVKTHPLSSIQKLSYIVGIRSSFAEIDFNSRLDIERFEEVMLYMLKSHPLLRSKININSDAQGMIELACPDRIRIPFIDLTYIPKSIKDIVADKVRDRYKSFYNEDKFTGDCLSQEMILIKRDERNYTFIMPCTHLAFDGMSNESFCNQILDLYKNKDKDMTIGKEIIQYDYMEYVNQIIKGPINTTQEEMMDRLELEDFDQAVQNYQRITKDLTFRTLDYVYKIEENKIVDIQDAMWRLSGEIYVATLKFLFPKAKIPVFIVHTGRRLMDKDFYDHIGEFIDFLPYVIDTDRDATLTDGISKKLDFLREHNINMASLFGDTDVQAKYPDVAIALSGVNLYEMNIPSYNYLALYNNIQSNGQDESQINIEKGTEAVEFMFDRTATNVNLLGDKIYISTLCIEGQEEALQVYLSEFIQKTLSNY
ncbi:non-ribosomal peptide synthetase [Fontibacillus panacisegetis]|nr:non-ribosomal peptide synthetase [Fontibacillus solani]